MNENTATDTYTGGNDRVGYDEMSSAFTGAKINRKGIVAEVEAVISNSDDPRDNDPRYSLEVRVRSQNTDTDRSESDE